MEILGETKARPGSQQAELLASTAPIDGQGTIGAGILTSVEARCS
jgi:hypothetical protein